VPDAIRSLVLLAAGLAVGLAVGLTVGIVVGTAVMATPGPIPPVVPIPAPIPPVVPPPVVPPAPAPPDGGHPGPYPPDRPPAPALPPAPKPAGPRPPGMAVIVWLAADKNPAVEKLLASTTLTGTLAEQGVALTQAPYDTRLPADLADPAGAWRVKKPPHRIEPSADVEAAVFDAVQALRARP